MRRHQLHRANKESDKNKPIPKILSENLTASSKTQENLSIRLMIIKLTGSCDTIKVVEETPKLIDGHARPISRFTMSIERISRKQPAININPIQYINTTLLSSTCQLLKKKSSYRKKHMMHHPQQNPVNWTSINLKRSLTG